MARINIEECWWSDPRRQRLGQLLGNPFLSEHVAVVAWRLAQQHWERDKLIPGYIFVTLFGAYEFLQAQLGALHETELIQSPKVRTPLEHISNEGQQGSNILRTHMSIIEQSYIYVRGSTEYLSWGKLERQKRVAAGVKSAAKRRELYGTAQPKPEHRSNTTPAASNILELSSSGSGSGSRSGSRSSSRTLNKSIVGIRAEYPSEFNSLWEAYGRVGDKKEGFEAYKLLKLNPEESSLLSEAIQNYTKSQPDPKYRKHFGRFLKTDWRETSRPPEEYDPNHTDIEQILRDAGEIQ